jgi:hypothetical protein
MLFKGPLRVVVMIEGFEGFGLVIGSPAMWAPSLSATAEMVLSTLSRTGCSGVGGPDSPSTVIVGRNKEAMTTLWLRKEDIDGCWGM